MKDNSNRNNFITKLFKFIGAIFAGFFIGCAIAIIYSLIMLVVAENKGDEIVKDDINENVVMTYEQITQVDAKNIMDTESDFVILDVRTEEEFTEGHIENAILIPDYEIATKAEEILKDKNQLILVYCRSGNRSKKASEALVDLGYTNVKEFGGIIDWKYEIVK